MANTARIDELRKKFEENPRRYFAPLANEYRKSGDINQAIAICREYLPQQPGHMSGHIVYGQALYEARQFDEAKTVFETALSLDPENLIALRHLGDIALIVGDSENARVWYRRVLEADPRNEEIQAQLATLDQAASAAPTPAVNPAVAAAHPAPAAPAKPAKPALSSEPTVVMSAVPRPGQAAPKKAEPLPEIPLLPVTPDSPTAEVRFDTFPTHAPPETERPVEMALGLEPTSFVPPAEPVPPAPALEIDTPVSASKEAPPLDSFSLAGLETTSLAAEPPPAPPAAAPEAVAPPAIDLDFGSVAPAAAPPPTPAPAAIPELPLLDIGDLPSAPAAAAPPPPFEPVPAVAEMLVPDAPARPAETPVQEEWRPPAVAAETRDVAAEAPAVAESGPFVTETMAELYLQQGHRDEALRVYRALLEQRPGDASLQAKVAWLAPAPAAGPPLAHEAPARADGGPTIREILSLIAMRRPGSHPDLLRQNGATPEAPAASLGADALAMVFGHVYIAPADEDAATALALAFMDLDGLESGAGVASQPEGISGAPARRASTDLSLDTVFGGAEAPAHPAPSSFSFDQFFSQRATAEHASQSGAPGAGNTESRGDVAQFTQWLEGLKQR